MSLNEKFLSKSKRSSNTSHSDTVIDSTVDSVDVKRPLGKQTLVALSKYTAMFPEKVCIIDGFLLASSSFCFCFV